MIRFERMPITSVSFLEILKSFRKLKNRRSATVAPPIPMMTLKIWKVRKMRWCSAKKSKDMGRGKNVPMVSADVTGAQKVGVDDFDNGGPGRTRTFEGISHLIYSQARLTASVPTHVIMIAERSFSAPRV